MNRLVRSLCFVGALLASGGLSHALTVPASEDTFGVSGSLKFTPAANLASTLMVDSTHKSYLYFNLDEVPQDAVLRWAKLRLFLPVVRAKGAGLGVHVVTSAWDEATASNVPTAAADPVAIIAPEKLGSRRFVTVDVTSTVQAWISGGTVNEGFAVAPIIKSGSVAAALSLTSKDAGFYGLPSELELEFKPDGLDSLQSSLRPLLTSGTFTLNDVSQLPTALRTFLTPTITVQPSVPSNGGSLAVEAKGLGTLSYQWMRNGVALSGGTSSQLPSSGLVGGTYAVAVSNGFSTVTSEGVKVADKTEMVTVQGGTLPSGSQLAGQVVKEFQIGKFEVTWAEWKTVRTWALANGYTDLANVGTGISDDHPVTNVNWFDVLKWCNARSEKEAKTAVYQLDGSIYKTGESTPTLKAGANGYRLPVDAEWEWAARGGKQTHGYTYSGSNDVNAVAWYSSNTSGEAKEVGTKAANELGVYDMSGNVFEWCWELSSQAGDRRVRGGSWYYDASGADVSYRNGSDFPDRRYSNFGFRVACGSSQ